LILSDLVLSGWWRWCNIDIVGMVWSGDGHEEKYVIYPCYCLCALSFFMPTVWLSCQPANCRLYLCFYMYVIYLLKKYLLILLGSRRIELLYCFHLVCFQQISYVKKDNSIFVWFFYCYCYCYCILRLLLQSSVTRNIYNIHSPCSGSWWTTYHLMCLLIYALRCRYSDDDSYSVRLVSPLWAFWLCN
jgi:hypothetical protein